MLYKLAAKLKGAFQTLNGVKTFGARALVVRGEEVLLVKHSYQDGWYTIGGAVESGESPLQAIKRELYEEVGIKLKSPPQLMGVYLNEFEKRNDYVALYLIRDFIMEEVHSLEISAKQWFDMAKLPSDVTPATKRRIEEHRNQREQSDKW